MITFKKSIGFIILCFISLNSFGQIPNLDSPENPLKLWEIKVSSIKKKDMVSQIQPMHFSGDQPLTDSLSLTNWHVLDYNLDGISDLLYTGYNGSESELFYLYRGYSNHVFEPTIQLVGSLKSCSKPTGSSLFSFTIVNYDCCAGYINRIEHYAPILENNYIAYKLQSKFAYLNFTDFPETQFSKPKRFKTTAPSYNLRATPELNDSTQLAEDVYGNIFAKYPELSEGLALAKTTDSTGRIWWFVSMKSLCQPDWSLYYSGQNSNHTPHVLGWMSSKYLEEITSQEP